jgi:hypothetical protein
MLEQLKVLDVVEAKLELWTANREAETEAVAAIVAEAGALQEMILARVRVECHPRCCFRMRHSPR